MTRDLPNWRSLLYVPASAEKFVAKAHERGADVVILDLEDGVAPDAKDAARAGLPPPSPACGAVAPTWWCASTARCAWRRGTSPRPSPPAPMAWSAPR